ncbi:MAG: formylglycine-generating enzyme family protein [Pleurocapsa minor GSE-CHR-MK-17-07R]|jgi:formylglycine-generating enzyme required for sulfatase activity|nr:formylglycine-generating enzyme family protein [Pleurocapsa minor GSE-CHR-MK 17-07R]
MRELNALLHSNHAAGTKVDVFLDKALTLTFVWCPPGEFLMGSRPDDLYARESEQPQHLVVIPQGFWISATILSVEQWRLFEPDAWIPPEGARCPAHPTTWDDAAAFCVTMTERLHASGALPTDLKLDFPTEEEWEYACRAGTKTTWYFGDDESLLADHAWYRANSDLQLHPLGLKLPNPWGLYDVYGNADEWCREDIYKYGHGNKRLSKEFRAIRGGDTFGIANSCRSAARHSCARFNEFNDEISLRPVLRSNAS